MIARRALSRALPWATALMVVLGLLQPLHPAMAQGVDDEQRIAQTFGPDGLPILLRADEISQDQELGVVVARGNVEVARGDRVLLADTLSYNRNAKTVTASGNIRMLEPSGEVIFADYIELSEDLLEGTIENLRILLADNARIAAAGGRRSDGNRTEMARAVYSPCLVCKDDPTAAPLWQVKANRVVHDQEAKQVDYYDAVLEFYGVPVAYTPYFTHPDPTVDRQTGFLAPSFGSTTNSGIFARTPFFWAIGDDRDATLDPILTQEQGIIYSGEYRQAFDTGYFDISGSLAIADEEVIEGGIQRTKEDQTRGHVFTAGEFHADPTWRWGWDINRSTDRSYLQKLSFWEDPGNSMTSTVYAEGFRGRNYASAEAFSYQDLRPGDRSDTPLILPLLNYNGLGEADSFGGRWSLDANARALTDDDNSDSQRLSVTAGYGREFVSSFGLLTNIHGSLRGDIYHVDQFRRSDGDGQTMDDGVTGRLVPRIGIVNRYPFARYSVHGRQVVEPIVAAFASPSGGNPEEIPNDDSSIFETDDINILAADRSNGLDRTETGQKAVAGLKLAHFGDDGERLSLFVGQAYRFDEDHELRQSLGIEKDRSDWVGRLRLQPNEHFQLFYRFNLEDNEFQANRNELDLIAGGKGLQFTSRYTFVRDTLDPTSTGTEELSLGISSQFDQYWTGSLSTLQDLEDDGGSLAHRAQLRYEDECFIFQGRYLRSYTRSVDVSEEDSIFFNLTFKTLGEVNF